MKIVEGGNLTLVKGIKAAGINCGIKSNRKDLALLYSEVPATAAGVFTRNQVVAAPVLVTKGHLQGSVAQAILVNSGIANAATGVRGMEDARTMASLTASALNIPQDYVLVASTGRIGHYLPMNKIACGIKQAVASLSRDGGDSASEAILTTDTFPKRIAVQCEIGGGVVTIAGMAKGAGMIKPNMATMLAFIMTDAAIQAERLHALLRGSVEKSFNRITVDGDMSTNDMVILMANGLSSDGETLMPGEPAMDIFREGLEYVCQRLALMIVKDGEGATKLVSINVMKASTEKEALSIAFRIAESPLVKTSIYGRSCNWGRVMAAAGSAGVPIDPERVDIHYGAIHVAHGGLGMGEDSENEAESYLKADEVTITVTLNSGEENVSVLTTDLSPEYVHINADYVT